MAKILLEMKNITKTFPGVKALDNVNLQVEEGEIHALVGENGAGKSTLMNVLSGLYPYGSYTGDIIYDYRNHGSQYTTFDGPYAYMVTAGAKLEIIERASGIILETITSPGNNQANGGFYGSYPCIYGDKMYIMGDSNKLYCYPKYPW